MAASLPIDQSTLFARLDALGIAHSTTTHPALFTVEDSQKIHHEVPGGHSKNLFLKDKRDQFFLLVAEQATRIDLKHLHKHLSTDDVPVGRLSFGKPERLMEKLGMTPGSVNPFSVLNDPNGDVRIYLDAALMAHDQVNFHPLINTATTSISSADLLRFLEEAGHPPTIVDFAALGHS